MKPVDIVFAPIRKLNFSLILVRKSVRFCSFSEEFDLINEIARWTSGMKNNEFV
jgi:hypothetical protein